MSYLHLIPKYEASLMRMWKWHGHIWFSLGLERGHNHTHCPGSHIAQAFLSQGNKVESMLPEWSVYLTHYSQEISILCFQNPNISVL